MVSRRKTLKNIERDLQRVRKQRGQVGESIEDLRGEISELKPVQRERLPQRRFGVSVPRTQERQQQVLSRRRQATTGISQRETEIERLGRTEATLAEQESSLIRQRKIVRDIPSIERQRREDIAAGRISVRRDGKLIPIRELPESLGAIGTGREPDTFFFPTDKGVVLGRAVGTAQRGGTLIDVIPRVIPVEKETITRFQTDIPIRDLERASQRKDGIGLGLAAPTRTEVREIIRSPDEFLASRRGARQIDVIPFGKRAGEIIDVGLARARETGAVERALAKGGLLESRERQSKLGQKVRALSLSATKRVDVRGTGADIILTGVIVGGLGTAARTTAQIRKATIGSRFIDVKSAVIGKEVLKVGRTTTTVSKVATTIIETKKIPFTKISIGTRRREFISTVTSRADVRGQTIITSEKAFTKEILKSGKLARGKPTITESVSIGSLRRIKLRTKGLKAATQTEVIKVGDLKTGRLIVKGTRAVSIETKRDVFSAGIIKDVGAKFDTTFLGQTQKLTIEDGISKFRPSKRVRTIFLPTRNALKLLAKETPIDSTIKSSTFQQIASVKAASKGVQSILQKSRTRVRLKPPIPQTRFKFEQDIKSIQSPKLSQNIFQSLQSKTRFRFADTIKAAQVPRTDVKVSQASATRLKLGLNLRTLTARGVPKAPKVPTVPKPPILPRGILLPPVILFPKGAVLPRRRRKKKKEFEDILLFAPDISARAAGVTVKITDKLLKKLATKEFTGAELRPIPIQ